MDDEMEEAEELLMLRESAVAKAEFQNLRILATTAGHLSTSLQQGSADVRSEAKEEKSTWNE